MMTQLRYSEICLNRENSEPLYLQLAGALRRQIGMTCLNSKERMISSGGLRNCSAWTGPLSAKPIVNS